ncbi:MAG TPA: hypothetical protein VLB44_10960 [Kofleriaceae bacterium]|nr:hypothetical protein [Kofleriaceae bacterium]
MRRAIVIALFVAPALALAGPRKKTAKKKAATPPPAETTEPADATPPADTQPTVPATTQATGLGGTKGTATPPLSSGTTPATTPAAGQAGGAGTGSGSGSGSAAPPPAEGKDKEETDKEPKDVDVDSLRQEYLSLRDELFKSRARANAVASQLYSTRVTIKFNWGSARYYGVSKASIRLDGATVYEDATGAIATDDGVRFDGYVAPGRHLVTFHVEATGKDDDSFTSSTETQVVVKAVQNKDLVVNAKGHDSGDIAYAWKHGEHGSYGLGIDVGVKTVASGAKK